MNIIDFYQEFNKIKKEYPLYSVKSWSVNKNNTYNISLNKYDFIPDIELANYLNVSMVEYKSFIENYNKTFDERLRVTFFEDIISVKKAINSIYSHLVLNKISDYNNYLLKKTLGIGLPKRKSIEKNKSKNITFREKRRSWL